MENLHIQDRMQVLKKGYLISSIWETALALEWIHNNKVDLFETIGIAISVFLASFISVISEYGSEVSFEKLSKENSNVNVKVVRNGIKCIIPIEEVVVNDIVLVESGDRVCADGYIIYGNVSIDESSISGESIEKLKNLVANDFAHCTYTEAIKILEKNNDNFEYKVKWGIDLQSEHERYITEEVFKKSAGRYGYNGKSIAKYPFRFRYFSLYRTKHFKRA